MTSRQRLKVLASGAEWLAGDVVALGVVGFMILAAVALLATPRAVPYCTNEGCHDNTGWFVLAWSLWSLVLVLVVVIPFTRSMLVRIGDATLGRVAVRQLTLEVVRAGHRPYVLVEQPSHWIPISEEQYKSLGSGRKLPCKVYSARWSGRVLCTEPA